MKSVCLKYGDSGLEVLTVQTLLKDAGSKISLTGCYDIAMVSAVRSFQKKNGLEITGKVDKPTYKKLKKPISWWDKLLNIFKINKKES